jgi:hypothetical protein
METHPQEHHCPSCNHRPHSVEALQARLAELEDANADDDATLEAWRDCFAAVCLAVTEVAGLDLDAVTTILEGLTVLAGEAHAKGATVRSQRNEWNGVTTTLRLVET